MEIYLTPRYEVEAWDSAGVVMDVMPPLEQGLTMRTRTRIHIAHIAAGGTLGEHPATRRQIFAVVQGLAHIDTDGEGKRELPAGSLVIWESGERHQTWAIEDVIAVVVETDASMDLPDHFERVL